MPSRNQRGARHRPSPLATRSRHAADGHHIRHRLLPSGVTTIDPVLGAIANWVRLASGLVRQQHPSDAGGPAACGMHMWLLDHLISPKGILPAESAAD